MDATFSSHTDATETAENDDEDISATTTSLPVGTQSAEDGLERTAWTTTGIFHVSLLSVLMLLTLLGNLVLIVIIYTQAELRHKRVNVFLLNLAVGDLMVCFATMSTEILFVAVGRWVLGGHWVLGNVGCKLVVYVQIFTLASTTFLLTAMSIDRYQVSAATTSCPGKRLTYTFRCITSTNLNVILQFLAHVVPKVRFTNNM